MNKLLLIALLFGACVYLTHGMAKWMTKEECGKVLRIGELIMGSEAKFSAKRTIRVYRDDGKALLDSGSEYIPGETLLVMLYGPNDSGIQYVFEAENAVFDKGGCGGKRVANVKLAKLIVPDSSEDQHDIQIIAGWSVGYDTVKITPAFVLAHPTRKPQAVPETPTDNNNAPAEADRIDPPRVPVRHEPMKGETIKLNLRTKKVVPEPEPVTPAEATPKHFEPIKLSLTPHNEEPPAHPIVMKLPDRTPPTAEKEEVPPPYVEEQKAVVPPPVAPTYPSLDGARVTAPEVKASPPEAPAVVAKEPAVAPQESSDELKKALATIQELAESIKQLQNAQNAHVHDPPAPAAASSEEERDEHNAEHNAGVVTKRKGKKKEAAIKLDVKSNTANRLRRNKQEEPSPMDRRKDFLGGKRKKVPFVHSFTEGTDLHEGVAASGDDVANRAADKNKVQIILSMVGLGVGLIIAVAVVILLLFWCVAHREDVSRIIGRVLRRKQGQDKE